MTLLSQRSFGDHGAGGQLAFGDNLNGVGFAYLTSRMGGPVDLGATELAAAVGSGVAG